MGSPPCGWCCLPCVWVGSSIPFVPFLSDGPTESTGNCVASYAWAVYVFLSWCRFVAGLPWCSLFLSFCFFSIKLIFLKGLAWHLVPAFSRNQATRPVSLQVDLVAQILLEEIAHRRVLVGRGLSPSDDVCFTSIATAGKRKFFFVTCVKNLWQMKKLYPVNVQESVDKVSKIQKVRRKANRT